MTTFAISSTASGIDFGQYQGRDEAEALDAFAQDAGYASYDAIPEEIGGGSDLLVVEVR